MTKNEKFVKFLESLKGQGQDILIENVQKGFRACCEVKTSCETKPQEILTLKDLMHHASHEGKVPMNENMEIEFNMNGDTNLDDYYILRMDDSANDNPQKLTILFDKDKK